MNKRLARRTARQNQSVFTVGEIARRLRITPDHVSNLIEGGELEAINVAGHGSRKWWRIPREAYERYVSRKSSLNLRGGKK